MEQSAGGVSAPLCSQRGSPLCCHSHLSVHHSPYLKLCRGLPLNCHLRFFFFFFPRRTRPLSSLLHRCRTRFSWNRKRVQQRRLQPGFETERLLRLVVAPQIISCALGVNSKLLFGFFYASVFCPWALQKAAAFTSSIYAGLKKQNDRQFDLQHCFKDYKKLFSVHSCHTVSVCVVPACASSIKKSPALSAVAFSSMFLFSSSSHYFLYLCRKKKNQFVDLWFVLSITVNTKSFYSIPLQSIFVASHVIVLLFVCFCLFVSWQERRTHAASLREQAWHAE